VEENRQQQVDKKGKGKASGKRFEVKKWNAVAMWSWAICTDTCAICRNNLYEPSIEYQANPTGEHLSSCSHVSRDLRSCVTDGSGWSNQGAPLPSLSPTSYWGCFYVQATPSTLA